MSKKVLWLLVRGLMGLSLVMAACGPTVAPTTPSTPTAPTAPITPTTPTTPVEKPAVKPAPETPKYGGTLNLLGVDITNFDSYYSAPGNVILGQVNQPLWAGDWAKGPAGGYGTNESDWGEANNDLRDLKTGYVAESSKWTIDITKDEGTIVYQIRQGIHWALNPNSEASRLMAGRELTADDVVFSLKRTLVDGSYLYRTNPELRVAKITKTGPWEVTIKLPIDAMATGISRFSGQTHIMPPDVIGKWGNITNWKNSVGTGPFMLADYVSGSTLIQIRNPNSWMKDPVGPGKGNQLPYIDGIRYLIIPDKSTQLAALRTAKIDQMTYLKGEDAVQLKRTSPALLEKITVTRQGRGEQTGMRTDMPPFNDIRVRRAMMMATDLNAINQALYKGEGQINTFPYGYVPEYADLYLAIDDPKFPASAKELYVYNPEKAKQLLKEAGYPNGFKTELLVVSTETVFGVDYYSVLLDMWAKVGVDVKLMIRDSAVQGNMLLNKTHPPMARRETLPIANFTNPLHLSGISAPNASIIRDPIVDEAIKKMQQAALTDEHEAMRIMKEMTVYLVDQAYVIPGVIGPNYHVWWPWLKNYSGELTLGGVMPMWTQWVWLDQALKKSMGY